ncbi:MAG: hypothetical protein AMJ62_15000 [Myxococcales bacterium SG8_38]|nr:MAG: hypothetical protein AMJ62_15000 [Myxococcales bacterium SG8_38]
MGIERRLGVVLICLVAACAARSAVPQASGTIDPRDLYPLVEGNAWSYDVDAGDGSTTLAITRVDSVDGRIAEVRTGRAVIRYEVLSEGIRIPAEDVWLIRVPLREGETWRARGGRTARLVSTRAHARTSAGDFDNCVEVLETGGELELEVQTVYCPGVGPVSVQSTMRSTVSDRFVTVSARLRGYEITRLPRPRPRPSTP